MSELPRPVIVDNAELYPRHVELHDQYGYNGQEPSEAHILEAFLHETDHMPRALNYEYMDLIRETKDFYNENEALGEVEVAIGGHYE